jgi:bacteriocin-like protein
MKELTPEEMKQVSGGIELPVLFAPPGERPSSNVYLLGLPTETGEFRFVVLTEQGLPFLATGGRLR